MAQIPGDRVSYQQKEAEHAAPSVARQQLRALARSTLSYQKRQTFVNVCCIALCPLLMVALAGILGIVITNLVNNSITIDETVYCSNATAPLPAAQVPGAALTQTIPQSQRPPSMPINTNARLGGPMDRIVGDRYTCVNWFEHDYPSRAPYEQRTDVGPLPRRDTTFMPDPEGGWFGSNIMRNAPVLAQAQNFPWAYVVDAPGVNSGRLDRQPPSANLQAALASSVNATVGSGLLGAMDTNYYVNVTLQSDSTPNMQGASAQLVPFFVKPSGSGAEEVDRQLADDITRVVDRLSQLRDPDADPRETRSLSLGLQQMARQTLLDMPWGALLFDQADPIQRQWRLTMDVGSDVRLARTGSLPTRGFRRLVFQALLGNAMAKTLSIGNSNTTITHGLRMFPLLKRSEVRLPIAAYTGRILFPFGISFLLPIFVIMLVRNKENRIFIMMSMNGMKARYYYFTYFVQFFLMQLVASIVFVLTGIAFRMQLFTMTDPAVYVILLLVWAAVQAALAFVISCFFSKSRTSLVVVFLLVLASVMINSVVEQLVPDRIHVAYFIWPPFAFYHSLSALNTASISLARSPYLLSDLVGDDQVLAAIIFLICELLVLAVLVAYLSTVLPSEYGVRKPWHFVVTEPLRWAMKRKQRSHPTKRSEEGSQPTEYIPESTEVLDLEEFAEEDEDVQAERERVLSNNYAAASPLVIKRIRKVYESGKVAVRDVTLAIEPDLVFGLLGPNGAGKTSLISILTGLYPPTAGQAWLNGYSVFGEMDKIYKTVGICPQHDILWDDLTVEEHLLFYARLKGVSIDEESTTIDRAIAHVALQNFKTRLSKGLSGGEKRRLSIAISLIGDPGVVFLDEPTTGLDPEVKRVIWDIIDRAKAGRSVVLTTHSMEEAEVLCRRIGIMANGTLRCIGSSYHLKNKYGKGFRLSLSGPSGRMQAACSVVEELLPEGWKYIDNFATSVSYEFHPGPATLSTLFETLEQRKASLGIDDWGISQTSLEEVFLKIIQDADANAE